MAVEGKNEAVIRKEVEEMIQDCHSQVLVMRYGNLFVNTKEHGLCLVSINGLEGNRVELSMSDLKPVTRDVPPEYQVSALFTDRRDNELVIVSES